MTSEFRFKKIPKKQKGADTEKIQKASKINTRLFHLKNPILRVNNLLWNVYL